MSFLWWMNVGVKEKKPAIGVSPGSIAQPKEAVVEERSNYRSLAFN